MRKFITAVSIGLLLPAAAFAAAPAPTKPAADKHVAAVRHDSHTMAAKNKGHDKHQAHLQHMKHVKDTATKKKS